MTPQTKTDWSKTLPPVCGIAVDMVAEVRAEAFEKAHQATSFDVSVAQWRVASFLGDIMRDLWNKMEH